MKTPVCLVCRREYGAYSSRNNHGYLFHGSPSSAWKGYAEDHPDIKFEKARPGRRKIEPAAPTIVAVTDPAPVERLTRTVPPKTEWNQAEGLEALPWVKYPKTPQEASSVAAMLGKLASTIPVSAPEHGIIMSQRDYYLAFGARLRKQVAA